MLGLLPKHSPVYNRFLLTPGHHVRNVRVPVDSSHSQPLHIQLLTSLVCHPPCVSEPCVSLTGAVSIHAYSSITVGSEHSRSQRVTEWASVIVLASYSKATAYSKFSGSPARAADSGRHLHDLVFCSRICQCFIECHFYTRNMLAWRFPAGLAPSLGSRCFSTLASSLHARPLTLRQAGSTSQKEGHFFGTRIPSACYIFNPLHRLLAMELPSSQSQNSTVAILA